MPLDSNEQIRQRAYEIWEREGRPHGRDKEHWRMAADELVEEVGTSATEAVPAARVPETAKPVEARPAPQADPIGLAQPKGDAAATRRGQAKPRGGQSRKPGSSAPDGSSRPH